MPTDDTRPYWETTTLADMTTEQWEALCDGCARCCLHKLQDEASGRIYFTMVACRLLDRHTCRCRDYPRRSVRVPECRVLTPATMASADWLPATCAYRRLAAGQPLAWWHPLVAGHPESVHQFGVSVRGLTLPEDSVHPEDWPRVILDLSSPPGGPRAG
jgi:uncharacterized cysteine cluster protein YcgN (CxxCxxCC family)